MLLAGEPGIGKTRLAQEVAHEAANRGFLVAVGRCYEAHRSVAYYPFLEVLANVYAAVATAISSEVPHRWPHLVRLLPDQSNVTVPPSTDTPEDQQRLFRAVSGFLREMAHHLPVAILLDDLHWADGASLEMLQHLARHTRGDRILLLATYRDVDVGTPTILWRRSCGTWLANS